jgi:TRAP-type C4-dicarboxylate transport system permease small subunit
VVAVVLFVVATLLAGLEIVLRELFDTGLVWAEEAVVVMMIWSVFLGASAVTAYRRHVRMDLLATSIRPKSGAAVEIAASCFVLLYVLAVTVLSWKFFWFLHGAHETDPSTGLPAWCLFVGLPIGMTLMILRSTGDLRARFRQWRGLSR